MTATTALRSIVVCLLLAGCTRSSGFMEGELIDLTYDFSPETIYWPTSAPFKLDTVFEGNTEKGYYYSAFQFCSAEHGGTHIDAPIHFARSGKSVDQLTLTQLIAPAVTIDVSQKATANQDYQVTVEDFIAWEEKHGKIPDGSIIMIRTGYGQHWPDRLKYLGTEKRGPEGVAALHFPGLSPKAASWLVKNRKIKAIGIDTASIDFGQSQTYGSHVTLMEQNIPAFENVANLDKLPVTGAHIIALPMKIKGGSGGPVRIIAVVPN